MAGNQAPGSRREPLSAARVFRAGVELAARDGFESVTMRKLAQELGVGAMSLYHYVPSREHLLDGMIDLVFEQIELPSLKQHWKTALRDRAISTRAALARNRWAVGLMEGRNTPGVASMRLRNAVLGCLRGGGFSVEMAVQAYSVQDAYIYGFALQEISLALGESRNAAEVVTGQVEEYDALRASRDVGALADQFPYLAEVVVGHIAEVGYDVTASFEYGLDLILDALEQRRDEV